MTGLQSAGRQQYFCLSVATDTFSNLFLDCFGDKAFQITFFHVKNTFSVRSNFDFSPYQGLCFGQGYKSATKVEFSAVFDSTNVFLYKCSK